MKKKMSFTISSKSVNLLKSQDLRCPKCSLIPFITISTNDNQLFMTTKCINDHIYEKKPFLEMQNLCKSSPFSNSSCTTCKNENKENSNLSDIFYYCSNCFNFYCLDHGKTHSINKGHNIFLNKNFENNCFEHNGINVVGYCAIHNKNYCVRCSDFDENNRIVDVELSDEQINDYEIQMKQNKKLLKDMEVLFIENKKIFENLEKNFNLFKDNINKKINFINEIINFYKIKKNESAINYQMKANIENNFFNLEQTKEIITYNLNIEQSEMNKLIQLLNEHAIFLFFN